MHDKQSSLGAALDMNPACSAAAALVVARRMKECLRARVAACTRRQLKGRQSMQTDRWGAVERVEM